jgi:hypothetical protein
MLYKAYLKKGMVYLPTTVVDKNRVYRDVDPVTVAPVADTDALRRAMRNTIPKENPIVTPSVEDARKLPVVLKHTGDKSWRGFMRGTTPWSVYEKDGKYQIEGYRLHRKGYWEQDPDNVIKFPAGTPLDDVIDRMIAILQDAAQG